MVRSSCHCGSVELTDCNCTICRRYGALWAYYSRRGVAITGATDVYRRGDKRIEFHRCKTCGCLTHWAPTDSAHDRMGINCRLMEPAALSAARVRKLDGFDTWTFLDEPSG